MFLLYFQKDYVKNKYITVKYKDIKEYNQQSFSHKITKENAIQDLELLNLELEKNYVFYEALEKHYQFSWESRKEDFIQRINSLDESELKIDLFYSYLNSYLSIAKFAGHLQIITPDFYFYVKQLYESKLKTNNNTEYIFETLYQNKSTINTYNYLSTVKQKRKKYSNSSNNEPVSNANFELKENGILYLRIPSFATEYEEIDNSTISDLLSLSLKATALLIDIRGNPGGSTAYWQNMLVPLLNDRDIFYSYTVAAKPGIILNKYVEAFSLLESASMSNIFINNEKYAVFSVQQNIQTHPKITQSNTPLKRYVLADKYCYSAAGMFIDFCQKTKFATVLSKSKIYSGSGFLPNMSTLPSSGFIFRYSVLDGINQDGLFDELEGLTPDVYLENDNLIDILKLINFKIAPTTDCKFKCEYCYKKIRFLLSI